MRRIVLITALLATLNESSAFTFIGPRRTSSSIEYFVGYPFPCQNNVPVQVSVSDMVIKKSRNYSVLCAGGFEYQEDEDGFDSIENPYKKDSSFDDDGTLKLDAARLLGPRLKGSSVYLVGMMGSGKSSVGNFLAKRMGTYSFLDTVSDNL